MPHCTILISKISAQDIRDGWLSPRSPVPTGHCCLPPGPTPPEQVSPGTAAPSGTLHWIPSPWGPECFLPSISKRGPRLPRWPRSEWSHPVRTAWETRRAPAVTHRDRAACFLLSAGFMQPMACSLRRGQAAHSWGGSKVSFCWGLVKFQVPHARKALWDGTGGSH